jgi:hypothetical protein
MRAHWWRIADRRARGLKLSMTTMSGASDALGDLLEGAGRRGADVVATDAKVTVVDEVWSKKVKACI